VLLKSNPYVGSFSNPRPKVVSIHESTVLRNPHYVVGKEHGVLKAILILGNGESKMLSHGCSFFAGNRISIHAGGRRKAASIGFKDFGLVLCDLETFYILAGRMKTAQRRSAVEPDLNRVCLLAALHNYRQHQET